MGRPAVAFAAARLSPTLDHNLFGYKCTPLGRLTNSGSEMPKATCPLRPIVILERLGQAVDGDAVAGLVRIGQAHAPLPPRAAPEIGGQRSVDAAILERGRGCAWDLAGPARLRAMVAKHRARPAWPAEHTS